jgi:selenophosphate synthase
VLEFLDAFTDWGPADDAWRGVLGDPQTSGGLLIATAAEHTDDLIASVGARGGTAARVGRFAEGESGAVRLR